MRRRTVLWGIAWLLVAGAAAPLLDCAGEDSGRAGRTTAAGADRYTMFGGCVERTSLSESPGPGTDAPLWTAAVPLETGGPAVADGRLFIGASDQLLAFDSETGAPLWNFTISKGRVTTHPLVTDGLVVFGAIWSDGYLYALNVETGEEAWKVKIGEMYTTSPLSAGGVIYAGVNYGSVYAIDPGNGSILANLAPGASVYMHSSVAYHDSVLYCGQSGGGMFAVRVTDGRRLWTSTSSYPDPSSIVYSGGRLFVHASGNVAAVDPLTGLELWRTYVGGGHWSAISAAPAAAFGRLYVGTQSAGGSGGGSAAFHCLAQETGGKVWNITLDGDILSTPVVASNGIVYVTAKSFYALDALTGSVLWTVGGGGSRAQAALANGTIYLNSVSGVIAIRDRPAPDRTAPGPPRELAARATAGGILLDWFPPASDGGAPVTAYRIYRGNGSAGKTLLDWTGALPGYTDALATSGATYHYCVTAVNVIGEGNFSNAANATAISNEDLTGPLVRFTSHTNGQTVDRSAITVYGYASDDSGVDLVEVSLDGLTWVRCQGTTQWSADLVLRPGRNTIQARAEDSRGNVNYTWLTIDYVSSTTYPEIAISSPPDGSNQTVPTAWVRGTAWGPNELSVVELSLDNSRWTRCSGLSDWSGNITLSPGSNTIYARVRDVLSRTATVHIHVAYRTSETGKPSITITSPREGSTTTTSSVTVRGNAYDVSGITRVEIRGPGDIRWTNCSGTTSWTGRALLLPGRNTIRVRATDGASQANQAEATVNVTLVEVDHLPPSVRITSPSDGDRFASWTVRVSGTARDNVAVTQVVVFTRDGNRLATLDKDNWSCEVPIVEGPNEIIVRAFDAQGNVGTDSIVVYYDEKAGPRPSFWTLIILGPLAAVAAIVAFFALFFMRSGPKAPKGPEKKEPGQDEGAAEAAGPPEAVAIPVQDDTIWRR